MDKYLKRILFIATGLLINIASFAQQPPVQMADTMRSNGKIYVVVAVSLTILIGLFIYLFVIDRKISRFEKESR